MRFFLQYLLLFHCDDYVGAHTRAGSAADALIHFLDRRDVIALRVEGGSIKRYYLLGADGNTEPAAFAALGVKGYLCHPKASSIDSFGVFYKL
jgi:hypothetical protein